MDLRKIIAVSAMLLCAASAVSCGKDKTKSSEPVKVEITSGTSAAVTEAEKATENAPVLSEASSEGTTSEEQTSETSQTTTETPGETTTAAEVTTTEALTEAPTQAPSPDKPSFEIGDLGRDAAPYISALGAPIGTPQEAPGCLSNGASLKIYQYDGLELQCYILDGKEYIYNIQIKNSNYTTSYGGITVGSTREQTEAAFGKGSESTGYVIYAASADREMDVYYNGDTVSMIEYYMSV